MPRRRGAVGEASRKSVGEVTVEDKRKMVSQAFQREKMAHAKGQRSREDMVYKVVMVGRMRWGPRDGLGPDQDGPTVRRSDGFSRLGWIFKKDAV